MSTKEQLKKDAKLAKANWKLSLKTNIAKVRENQNEIVRAILKSPIPKWGGFDLKVVSY